MLSKIEQGCLVGNTTNPDREEFNMATLAVRGGQIRTPEGEHSEPIFATSSFVFDSAEDAAARFNGDRDGNIYSRFTNPTVNAFERRLGVMEEASFCVATSSGMAAITGLVLSCLRPGDHIVASWEMFGSTVSLFSKIFDQFPRCSLTTANSKGHDATKICLLRFG